MHVRSHAIRFALITAGVFAVAALTVTAVFSADKRPSLTRFRNSYLTFSAPASWHPYLFKPSRSPHQTAIVDLSSQPAHDPCRPAPVGLTCGWPVDWSPPIPAHAFVPLITGLRGAARAAHGSPSTR